jgi:hypothetical protein
MRLFKFVSLSLTIACAGCGTDGLEGREAVRSERAPPVVDSILPIPVALERFRADIAEVPTGLRGGAESAEALVRELVRLIEADDTLGFEAIALDRAEFAYLYYESTPLARPPYELPPALAWFQLQQGNRTSVLRLLRELGGRPLGYAGLVCDRPSLEQGENRIWSGCRVRIERGDSAQEMRLFGALIERDGRFKVLSHSNDL